MTAALAATSALFDARGLALYELVTCGNLEHAASSLQHHGVSFLASMACLLYATSVHKVAQAMHGPFLHEAA